MMVCEEDVVNWFQGLKGHQRIPVLRQLVHMCHPLELRFIASCVEDACRTDCLTMRSAELNANTQNVLKSLESPLDVEARSKIIVYLCLLNSTNKLCSRILRQKICDHESVAQFCDDVHRQLMDGELPSTEEQRTLDELRLLYLLASLHPSFDFIERQHYRDMCSSLNDLERKLKNLERKEELQKQVESVVPKPCCDGGSQRDNASKSCSLCFSTSAFEHICKLRLLPARSAQEGGDSESQVNVQWSTGKFSNLVIRDSQLRQLHARLESWPPEAGVVPPPRLPPLPHDLSDSGQLNSYLQHLQGLSAVPWPRSESVYQFFRQLADEQEQRVRCAVSPRPHSVYTPRPAEQTCGPPPATRHHPITNGVMGHHPAGDVTPHKLTEITPHKLTMPLQNGSTSCDADDSSETSPAVLDEDAEVRSCTIYNSNLSNGRAGSRSPLSVCLLAPARPVSPERPPPGWSPRAASHSPAPPPPPPPLTNGLSRPRPAASDGGGMRTSTRRRPPASDSRAGSVEKDEASWTAAPAAAPVSVPSVSAASCVPAAAVSPVATSTGTAAYLRNRPAAKAPVAVRPPVSSAPPLTASPAAVAAAAAAQLQPRIICSQTGGLMPLPPAAVAVAAAGGAHTHTVPTYSCVTAHNCTTAVTPAPPHADVVRCVPASDGGQLVYPGHGAGSPPPPVVSVAGYRPPSARCSVSELMGGGSPSPPAPSASPAAPLPPPPPPPGAHALSGYLPAYSAHPPPPMRTLVYPAGAGFMQHSFHPAAADMAAFYTAGPYQVQYAAVPPPPRAAPPPPPPPLPSRPHACYNCGHGGHVGRYCTMENAMNDASQQNQFKMAYVSSISEH